MLISLTVGDWSNDGHGRTEQFVIESNLDKEQLERAYQLGCEKLGFDFSEKVARDYQDSTINNELYQKLCDAGYKSGLESGPDYLTIDDYVLIWVFICRLGNERTDINLYPTSKPENINIGGYGLFL